MWYDIFNMYYRWENDSLDKLISASVYKDWDKYIVIVSCEELNSRICVDFDDLQVAISNAYKYFSDYYKQTVL